MYGTISVEVAGTLSVAVVDVPAAVQVSVAEVPDEDELATSSCQTRMLWPADDATRFAADPVPVTATDSLGR